MLAQDIRKAFQLQLSRFALKQDKTETSEKKLDWKNEREFKASPKRFVQGALQENLTLQLV